MGRGVILERGQRDPGQRHEAARDLGKEISLLMGRQQNIEFAAGEQLQQEIQIAHWVVAEARTAMKASHEARETPDADRCRVTNLDFMTFEAKRCDRLAGGEARSPREENSATAGTSQVIVIRHVLRGLSIATGMMAETAGVVKGSHVPHVGVSA